MSIYHQNTPRHKISPRYTSQSSFNRSSTLSCACCVVHSLAWRNAVQTQYSCARVCWRDAPCRLAIGGRKLPPSLVEHTSFFVDCGPLRGFRRLMMAWFARGEGGGSWKSILVKFQEDAYFVGGPLWKVGLVGRQRLEERAMGGSWVGLVG